MAKKQSSNKAPLVNIILPTFNRARTIVRVIDSVLNQSFTDFEIIIVDDDSSNDTRKLVAEIPDKRLRYIQHSERNGAGASRNTGIAVARGKYIAFQDSDDEWVETKFDDQLAVLNARPEIGAVYSPYMRISAEIKKQIPPKISSDIEGDILATILGRTFIGTPTLLIRRSSLIESGGGNEKLQALEDWELSMRLARHCRFACIKKPLLHAYVTTGSVSENEETIAQTVKQIVALQREDYGLHPSSEAKVWTFIGNRNRFCREMFFSDWLE